MTTRRRLVSRRGVACHTAMWLPCWGCPCRGRTRIGSWLGGVSRGLTVWQADQVAVVLGCHPCELWPSWWADAREDLPEDRVGCAVAAARVWCVEQQEWERERRRVWVEWVRAVDAAERWADRRAARVGLVSG